MALLFWQAHLLSLLPGLFSIIRKKGTTFLFLKCWKVSKATSFFFQSCWPRHRRVNGTIFGGICEPCQCFGHAESCDDITGECLVSASLEDADWQDYSLFNKSWDSIATFPTLNMCVKRWYVRTSLSRTELEAKHALSYVICLGTMKKCFSSLSKNWIRLKYIIIKYN